ncbi:Regulator of chromosome condensation (RCC1) repeat protein [compost metagenome]
MVCWGENGAGQLGDGSTTQRNTPVAVPGLNDATSLAVGYGFSCALKADGSAACWGVDHGNGIASSAPVMVSGGAVFWR